VRNMESEVTLKRNDISITVLFYSADWSMIIAEFAVGRAVSTHWDPQYPAYIEYNDSNYVRIEYYVKYKRAWLRITKNGKEIVSTEIIDKEAVNAIKTIMKLIEPKNELEKTVINKVLDLIQEKEE